MTRITPTSAVVMGGLAAAARPRLKSRRNPGL